MSIRTDVGAKYRMYLNYDNDKKVYIIPVLPEKIKITVKGQTSSIDIDKFGEILCKGKRTRRKRLYRQPGPVLTGLHCATFHRWIEQQFHL